MPGQYGAGAVDPQSRGDACSAREPTADNAQNPRGPRDGEGRNRTGDTTIFSRVLYQLSYLARGA